MHRENRVEAIRQTIDEEIQVLRFVWVFLLLGVSTCVMANEQERTITVNGTGTAEVEPDRPMKLNLKPSRRLFQFALRTLMIATLVTAVQSASLGLGFTAIDDDGITVTN